MDKEKLKLFQNAILLLILTVVSSIYLIVMFIYPKASTISSLSADYKAALEKQATMEQKYDAIKASLAFLNVLPSPVKFSFSIVI